MLSLRFQPISAILREIRLRKQVQFVTQFLNFDYLPRLHHTGQIAGLNVMQIVNEPTAAAIAFCYDRQIKEKKLALVYDLGGGTFDVSLVQIQYETETSLLYPEVIASNGDGHLGGLDFTSNVRDLFVEEFLRANPGK